jgi:LmbE family N-acetylglucosaminyl deacetylase
LNTSPAHDRAPLRLDRVLIIAPHPDDDVIAAGGLIQRTLASGGTTRILFLTAGEHNDWAQRAYLRKWRITREDRDAWAGLRMAEASEALTRLGASTDSFELLRYPDRQLGMLARRDPEGAIARLKERIDAFDPTLVAVPSTFDLHGDHRAAAFLAHRATREPRRVVVTYVIHGAVPPSRIALTLELSPAEQARKRSAIEAHATQLLLGRGRFLAYATGVETFLRSEEDQVRVPSPGRDRLDALRHSASAIAKSIRGRMRRSES